ncbi:MAG: response regulator [Nitrospirae bacterium]|nr:response regulator [Nitrospirota bacterium]
MNAKTTECKTILIADDEIFMRNFLKNILERAGYKVIEACDGDDAVQKFAANAAEIQLLVLDVKMPVKTGREAYAEMKKIKPGIKAIFISGFHNESSDTDNFIAKPFPPQALLDRMKGIYN